LQRNERFAFATQHWFKPLDSAEHCSRPFPKRNDISVVGRYKPLALRVHTTRFQAHLTWRARPTSLDQRHPYSRITTGSFPRVLETHVFAGFTGTHADVAPEGGRHQCRGYSKYSLLYQSGNFFLRDRRCNEMEAISFHQVYALLEDALLSRVISP
jgi:hypothetical protein